MNPFRSLEESFRTLATRVGAVEEPSPAIISRATLEQFDYFESFPHRAVAVDGSKDRFHPPALCYFLYERLRGRRIDPPLVVTTAGRCARREEELRPPFRLLNFTMREIIFLGSRSQVERMRQRLLRSATALAEQWGLRSRVEAATDPFFIETARGRKLLQRLKELKYELIIDSGGDPVALASFNHHEDFFGRRMEIRLLDGSFAHSGCVAFGLERWAAALAETKAVEVAAHAS